jgi:cold shock CspA family protein
MRDYFTLGAKHEIVMKVSHCLVETA